MSKVHLSNSTGPVIEEYTYDDEGQRAMKFEPARNQRTYYINKYLVRVVNGSGTFDTVYFYYYDGDTLVAREEFDGKSYFCHPDRLGSTTLITDEQGNVVEEITYGPYGKIFSGQAERFVYPGKEMDKGK